jgi:hypothetical protein
MRSLTNFPMPLPRSRERIRGRGRRDYFGRGRRDYFVGGNPDGENVDLMITGVLKHNGVKGLFATSATVKVNR